MKFIDKHPEGPREFRPLPEKEVEAGVVFTGRWFGCVTCGLRSPFRIFENEEMPGVPCCSEECAHTAMATLLELLGDQYAADLSAVSEHVATAITEGPSNSLVDGSPDTGEAMGSIPILGTTVNDQTIV